jgi:DNA-binding CsgD family transcriptional regulator
MKTEAVEMVQSVDHQAAKRANEKALSARWNVNIVIFANAVFVAVVLMGIEGVAVEILAPVAVVGLSMIWLVSWLRWRRLYHQFYEEELSQIDEVTWVEKKQKPIESPLSLREMQILSLIASGYVNKQVATEFGISEHTIKNHMTHILEKLDVCDRTHAVVIAMQNGWISPSDTISTLNGKSNRNSLNQYLKGDSSSITAVH